MMRFLLFGFFLIITLPSEALTVQSVWNDQFVKELHMTCNPHEPYCFESCGAYSSCVIEEKTCRSCVGTGLAIQRILTELGRSIRPQVRLSSLRPVLNLILSGYYVTISSRDPFNVIDGFESISVLRKFERLCPGETDDQLLFIELNVVTRNILRPRFVFCQSENLGEFFELKLGDRMSGSSVFYAPLFQN